MNSRFSKKGLMVALGSSVFALSSFTAVHAGVCVLDFAKVEPAVSYDGYPNYFNSGSSHEHSITDKWNSVVVKRFLSCYQKTFPRLGMDVSRENCLEETVGETIHIWYPLPDGQDAKVTSAHWFEDASSCAQLRKNGILPPVNPDDQKALLATDVILTATKNGSGVDLTLTTSAEQDTAALLILSGDKLDNGGTEIDVACDFPSGGSPYTCTDDVAADTYRAAEIEYDGSLILYDEVTPKK